MSTIEVKMFSLICDGCGADVNEGTDFAAYAQEFASREIADDQGWLTTFESGKDWCPDCIEWDEDGNEQRPKPPPTGAQEESPCMKDEQVMPAEALRRRRMRIRHGLPAPAGKEEGHD